MSEYRAAIKRLHDERPRRPFVTRSLLILLMIVAVS